MRTVYFGSRRLSFRAKLIIGLMLGLSVALLSLMALLAIGMLLFLLPVAVLGAAIYALLPRRKAARQRPGVLEGQYRVVDPKDRDRLPRD